MEDSTTTPMSIDWKGQGMQFIMSVLAVCVAIWIMQKIQG